MKNILSDIWKGFFLKEHFVKRLVIVVLAVIVMGFSLTWLIKVDYGTDPCTLMNQAISSKLHLSLGNWQALFNTVLLILVVLLGARNLGFGTLANMFLVGYSIDFFSWLFTSVIPVHIPDSLPVKIAVLIPALVIFVFAAAVYMDVDMGTAPYDAISFIIASHLPKIPFKAVRIAFDFTVVLIALLFGAKLGIVTFLMALTLGPVISLVGQKMERFLK